MIKILEAPSYHFYQRHIPFFITVVVNPAFVPYGFSGLSPSNGYIIPLRVHRCGALRRRRLEWSCGLSTATTFTSPMRRQLEIWDSPGMVFRRTQVPQKRGFKIHLFLKNSVVLVEIDLDIYYRMFVCFFSRMMYIKMQK